MHWCLWLRTWKISSSSEDSAQPPFHWEVNIRCHRKMEISLWSSGYFSEVKTCLGVECRSIFASRQNFATIEDDSFAVFGVKKPLIWNASKIDQLKVAKYALWRFRNDVPKIEYNHFLRSSLSFTFPRWQVLNPFNFMIHVFGVFCFLWPEFVLN